MPQSNDARTAQMNNIPEHAHDKASVSHDNEEAMKKQNESAQKEDKSVK